MEIDNSQREINWKPTKKQYQAWKFLQDKQTTEILYGGSAGNGKSYLGSAFLISFCLAFPGSRGLMGRSVLKQLKQSTLLTFFEVCKNWGIEKDIDYHYDGMAGVITFLQNQSQVYLKDLSLNPSDPEFDSIGSTEYSFAFIDEATQISEKAKNVVKSRLRYKLDEFGIVPKLLMCSNPGKNFLYFDFYKPSREETLERYRAFVPALPGDNPHLPISYIETLKTLDKVTKDRLLFGNWEYSSDDNNLIEYDSLIDLFTNSIEGTDEKWCVVDVARFGSDKTVISLWKGLEWYSVKVLDHKDLETVEIEIKNTLRDEMIPFSHCVIDEDGIGGGVLDHIKGAKGFIAQRTPFVNRITGQPENYRNLRTQCSYRLSDFINSHQISITWFNEKYRNEFIEEAEQLKRANIDKDGKLEIEPKSKMKELIKRSPDLLDTAIMRMMFELQKPTNKEISINPVARLLQIPQQYKNGHNNTGVTNYD